MPYLGILLQLEIHMSSKWMSVLFYFTSFYVMFHIDNDWTGFACGYVTYFDAPASNYGMVWYGH